MSFKCLECERIFENERSLHAHLKAHKIDVASYYCKHFPRRDLFSGEPLPYKNKDEYFSTYFGSYENLLSWLKTTPPERKSPIILDMLDTRIRSKEYFFAPNEIELFFAKLPPIAEYQKCFGSYRKAAEACGVPVMLGDKLPPSWNLSFSHKKIWVDSREQQPLKFPVSERMKLDVGDYGVAGKDFAYTFVDRKSLQDWAGTLVGDNFERFRREVLRCKMQDCFLWVVIEHDLFSVERAAREGCHKINLPYVTHQMRILQHEFKGSLEFAFSGSREESQKIIPKLLCLGQQLWGVDLQYWLNKERKI